MSVADVDAVLASPRKRLPAKPQWIPHKSRLGEMKARLPIEIGGATGRAEIEITIHTADPLYFVIVLLVPPACASRLCIGSGHRNRITGETITDPHFHRWAANRHLNARTRENLPYAEPLPNDVVSREAAFAWFLQETGIESPTWLPIIWPGQGDLF